MEQELYTVKFECKNDNGKIDVSIGKEIDLPNGRKGIVVRVLSVRYTYSYKVEVVAKVKLMYGTFMWP